MIKTTIQLLGRNRSSDKSWDSDQRDNIDENRLPTENGRGRGLRDDRSSSDRRSAPGRGNTHRKKTEPANSFT